MQLINYPPGDPQFTKALATLFTAGTTGLAIAAGASLGIMAGRPLKQKLALTRNSAPFTKLMRLQIRPKQKLGIVAHPFNFFRPKHDQTPDDETIS